MNENINYFVLWNYINYKKFVPKVPKESNIKSISIFNFVLRKECSEYFF